MVQNLGVRLFTATIFISILLIMCQFYMFTWTAAVGKYCGGAFSFCSCVHNRANRVWPADAHDPVSPRKGKQAKRESNNSADHGDEHWTDDSALSITAH